MIKRSRKVVLSITVCFILIYMFAFSTNSLKLPFNIISGDENISRSKVAMDLTRASNIRRATSEIWRNLMKPQSKTSFSESVDQHYSQSHQDQTVYDIFPQKNGFFIEMGAYDGKVHSNTLWLERKHNWTGLLIEGNHKSCRSIDRLHRQIWRLCACVSKETEASFIMGKEVGGVENNMPKSHLVHLNNFQRAQIP